MSSLDRAFFRAYEKDQPAPVAEENAAAESVSPFVHFQSTRQPQLRYRLEPTHAPWGHKAAAPHVDGSRLAVPDHDVYELLDHDEQPEPVAPMAWSAFEAPQVLAPAEPPTLPITAPLPRPNTSPMLEAMLRSLRPMEPIEVEPEEAAIGAPVAIESPPEIAPAASPAIEDPANPAPIAASKAAIDPYSSGIVCLPGMDVPESNYLATLLIEQIEVELPTHAEPPQVQPVVIEAAIEEPPPAKAPMQEIAESSDTPEAGATETAALLADTPAAFWEVDQYLYPSICDELLQQYSYFKHAGEKLKLAAAGGLKVLAITGIGPAEGRTTLAICLARAAAASGVRVALIDCDFQNPQLAHSLGLEINSGWQSIAASDSANLAEVAVRSVDDGVLLLPLADDSPTRAMNLADESAARLIRKAANSFDVVILDAGAFQETHLPVGQKPCFDAAIVVCDRRNHELSDAEQVARAISEAGVEAVGIAENFSS